jgi:serine/threonine-protein kinase
MACLEDMAEGEPERLERLVEEYLLALADGALLTPEAYRERVPPGRFSWFQGKVLAGEFRWRLGRGENVRPDDYLGHLDPEARAVFRDALADAHFGAASLPVRLEPGTLIRGRYLILRALGEGGQASVFAAYDRELEVEVALKFLNQSGTALPSPEWEAIVRGESQLLARLRSRNIVRVYDVVRDGEKSFLVMDLVRGLDLRAALDRLRASPESGPALVRLLGDLIGERPSGEHGSCLDPRSWQRTATRIAAVVARTIASAHAQGVIHRDLKPANVMLVAGGEPVLLDFGLASRSGSATAGFHGTPGYVAPEQVREERSGEDPRTDVYQLGLILYELLTQEQAFPERPGENWIARVLRAERGLFEPPRAVDPEVHEALEAICLRALAREQGERYQRAEELALDLERFARGLPPLTACVPRRTALRMRAGHAARHPVGVVGGLAVLAVSLSPMVFAREGWRSPDVVPVLQDRSGTRALVGGEPLEVGRGAMLEILVDCPEPAYLYAFSIYGPLDALQLKPVAPEFQPLPRHERRESTGPLRIEPGRHRIACAQIGAPAEWEGLLLFFSDERLDVLEEWTRALAAAADGDDPMSCRSAADLLATYCEGRQKGDSPGSLTPEQRAMFSRSLDESMAGPILKVEGATCFRWLFPIRGS